MTVGPCAHLSSDHQHRLRRSPSIEYLSINICRVLFEGGVHQGTVLLHVDGR
jgi:hypothetical protein